MKGEIKNLIRSIIIGLILAFLEWVQSEFWRNESVKQHIISFLVTFSPLLIGFLGFIMYWLIVFSRKIYKKYIYYERDRKVMNDKINLYQQGVISLGNQVTKIDNRLDGIETLLRTK